MAAAIAPLQALLRYARCRPPATARLPATAAPAGVVDRERKRGKRREREYDRLSLRQGYFGLEKNKIEKNISIHKKNENGILVNLSQFRMAL